MASIWRKLRFQTIISYRLLVDSGHRSIAADAIHERMGAGLKQRRDVLGSFIEHGAIKDEILNELMLQVYVDEMD